MSTQKSTHTKTIRIITILFILVMIFLAASNAMKKSEPFNTNIDYIDQEKFSGEWYVISNIPYFAEKGKVATKTTYTRRGPGLFDDIFESKDGSFDKPIDKITGQATSLNKQNTKWKSTFYWFISFEYEVLHVDQDYNIMLLGHRSRDYGWLMSRTKTIPQKDLNKALTVFAENGYDTSKFKLVPQTPEQLSNTTSSPLPLSLAQ